MTGPVVGLWAGLIVGVSIAILWLTSHAVSQEEIVTQAVTNTEANTEIDIETESPTTQPEELAFVPSQIRDQAELQKINRQMQFLAARPTYFGPEPHRTALLQAWQSLLQMGLEYRWIDAPLLSLTDTEWLLDPENSLPPTWLPTEIKRDDRKPLAFPIEPAADESGTPSETSNSDDPPNTQSHDSTEDDPYATSEYSETIDTPNYTPNKNINDSVPYIAIPPLSTLLTNDTIFPIREALEDQSADADLAPEASPLDTPLDPPFTDLTELPMITTWGIWNSLIFYPISAPQSPDALRPWIELKELLYRDDASYAIQQQSLTEWENRWPAHPAQIIADHGKAHLATLEILNEVSVIGIYLPLSSSLQSVGEAILNGLFASYYEIYDRTGWKPRLVVLDSTINSAKEAMDRFSVEGVEFVIGPVDSDRVYDLLEEMQRRIPLKGALFLNYTEQELPQWTWQYGLPVETEAHILAQFATHFGWFKGGGLISESRWARRAAETFEYDWINEYNGSWGGTEAIREDSDFTSFGQNLFLLRESRARFNTLRFLVKQELHTEYRRRNDLDFLFLVTRVEDTRRLRATLNFNQGHDIPIFAVSSVYEFTRNDDLHDLLGITIADAPWVIEGPKTPRMLDTRIYPRHRSRLFAMGIDSWQLTRALLTNPPSAQFPINGATGGLWSSATNRIQRRPVIATLTDIDERLKIIYR